MLPPNEIVSVVLALYNGEAFLREQIDSILSQTHASLELIIMDDASTDGGPRIAGDYAKKDARVRFVRNDHNLGLVANFMKGVSLAKGDAVCYSDQDDVWRPDKIEKLLELLNADPSRMLAYSDLEICDSALNVLHGSFWKASGITPREGAIGERALLKNIPPGCSMLFRKDVAALIARLSSDAEFNRVNRAERLDDMPVMHDHLAWIAAAGLGKAAFTRERLVRYRQHGSNTIGADYPAESGVQHFVRLMLLRLKALSAVERSLPRIRWTSMRDFIRAYGRAPRAPMPSYLGYFMWMRGASPADQALGAVDCLLPSGYLWMKRVFAR